MAQVMKLRQEDASAPGQPLGVAGPLGKLMERPRRWRQFVHEVRVEMRQVNWPSRQDVWSTTIVVTVTVAFFGLFFFVTDSGLSYVIERILKVFK